jgi:hypothetical protein
VGPGDDDLPEPDYADASSSERRQVTRDFAWVGGAALAAILVAFGFAVWPSLTVQSSTLVLGVGGAFCVVAMRRPLTPGSERRRWQQWAPWLCLALATALWELALLLLGNNNSWPPLSLLAAPIDTLGLGRFSLALLWLAGGVWLVRRLGR